MRFEITELRPPLEETKHGAHFAGGTAGNVDKRQQFVRGATFEPFSDVVGNGERCAIELVTLRIGDSVARELEKILRTLSQCNRLLPHGEVLETLVGRHGGWDFSGMKKLTPRMPRFEI